MIRPIRAVKREIRTLGLDTCNPNQSIGIVVRGRWLDGVISFPRDSNNALRDIGTRIIESAYYPELRAIMLHGSIDHGDRSLIERLTNLPTIAIANDKPLHDQGYKAFQGTLGQLWIMTRIAPGILKKILAVSWTTGKLPEPLRIAHLLAESEFPAIAGDKG